jgi:hypothetical protein
MIEIEPIDFGFKSLGKFCVSQSMSTFPRGVILCIAEITECHEFGEARQANFRLKGATPNTRIPPLPQVRNLYNLRKNRSILTCFMSLSNEVP